MVNLTFIKRVNFWYIFTKLMRFNRPKAKINLIYDSNCLLINFFNPISAVCFNDSIQIWTHISNPNWNYIEN